MTSNVAEIQRLFGVSGSASNLPLYSEIYPKREAPIIRADKAGIRHLEVASWGVSGPPAVTGPVTNIRNLSSSLWRGALAKPSRRCLVPVTAFVVWTVEPDPATGRNRKVWFEMCDGEPFVFAGIVFSTGPDQRDRFAFLTCAPNTVVGAVHPTAMPVILHGAAKDAWLTGDAAAALALPLADELMRIVE